MRRTYRPSIALAAGLFAAAAPAVGWAQDDSGKDVDDVLMSVVKDPDGSEREFANEISVPARPSGEDGDDSSNDSNEGGETRGLERALEVVPEDTHAYEVLEALEAGERPPLPEEARGLGRDAGNAVGRGRGGPPFEPPRGKPDSPPGGDSQ